MPRQKKDKEIVDRVFIGKIKENNITTECHAVKIKYDPKIHTMDWAIINGYYNIIVWLIENNLVSNEQLPLEESYFRFKRICDNLQKNFGENYCKYLILHGIHEGYFLFKEYKYTWDI